MTAGTRRGGWSGETLLPKMKFRVYTYCMKPLVIAIVVIGMMGVGVYIGASGLVSQYAFVPGRSSAGTAVCTPGTASANVGSAVQFMASNVPSGAPSHWSSPEGRATLTSGIFSVQFTSPGTKTVSLFYFDRNAWLRTTCEVQVR